MSKHTPGPWILEPGSQHRFPSVLIGQVQPRLTINAGGVPMSEHEANARLIAAAPELLEACQAINALDPQESSTGDWNEAFKLVAAAISKATGGQQ